MFGPAQRDHVVHFYEDESALCEMIARYIGMGIGAGESVLVIARNERSENVRRRLTANAIDLEGVVRSRQLTFLDAEAMLDSFMIDGMPDVGRFLDAIGDALFTCRRRRPRAFVRAYGEMVDILVERGNRDAALALEGLWNELASTQPLLLFCAYALERFASSADVADFDALCWAHSTAVPPECVTRQRERALAAEVDRRKELERELERLRRYN